MILIGIDPGVETGIAEWDTKAQRLSVVETMSILRAMRWLEVRACAPSGLELFVIFEDARKRKGLYSKMDREQSKYGAGVREGVGSVKRDCGIWEEFLTDLGVPFEARYPRNTKEDAPRFRMLTGWQGRTNEHSRDAGMIVFGINDPIARAKLIAFKDGQAAGNRPTRDRCGARSSV